MNKRRLWILACLVLFSLVASPALAQTGPPDTCVWSGTSAVDVVVGSLSGSWTICKKDVDLILAEEMSCYDTNGDLIPSGGGDQTNLEIFLDSGANVVYTSCSVSETYDWCAGAGTTYYAIDDETNDKHVIVHLGSGNDDFNADSPYYHVTDPPTAADPIRCENTSVTIYGDAGSDTIRGSNHVVAGDSLTGGDATDVQIDIIYGYDGNDYIYAGAGGDTIYGGEGYDHIYGEDGNDSLHGGPHSGSVYYDYVYGGSGADYLYGDDGDDQLSGDAGNDYLYGYGGDDRLYGGDHNDHLYGSVDSDFADGGSGDDVIDGGPDSDLVVGGSGNDTTYGGECPEDEMDITCDASGDDTHWALSSGTKPTAQGYGAVCDDTGTDAFLCHGTSYYQDVGFYLVSAPPDTVHSCASGWVALTSTWCDTECGKYW